MKDIALSFAATPLQQRYAQAVKDRLRSQLQRLAHARQQGLKVIHEPLAINQPGLIKPEYEVPKNEIQRFGLAAGVPRIVFDLEKHGFRFFQREGLDFRKWSFHGGSPVMDGMQVGSLRHHSNGMNPRQFSPGGEMMDALAMDETEFQAGYSLGWVEYRHGQRSADVVGASDDFRCGYWNGIGEASAWHEGWAAAECGLMVCPYLVGSDDECFRESWLNGFVDAMSMDSFTAWVRE